MLAAAAAVIAGALTGWVLRPAAPPAAPLREAALVTASHHPVGQAFLYAGDGSWWLYMTVDAGPRAGTVLCQVQGRGGHVVTLGPFELHGGHGHWGSPEPVQPAAVTGAELSTAAGKVLATAAFR